MKKIFAIILALAMTFALSATALADQSAGDASKPGTIKIDNATIGQTYKVYKVFDATIVQEGETTTGTAYTYTKTGESDALYDALVGTGTPFTLTPIPGMANKYKVTSSADGATVGTWLKNHESLLGNPVINVVASDTIIVCHVDYGYYYITSSLGTAVTVDSANPSTTVQDKNGKAGWNDGGKKVWNGTAWVTANSANIGEVVTFRITANVPKYNGETEVTSYKFVDTLGVGLTYQSITSVKIVDGSTTVTLNEGTALGDQIYILSHNDRGFTLEFNPKLCTTGYPANGIITIEYTAKINENATADNLTNTAQMFINNSELPGDDPHTETEVYGFNLIKTKGNSETVLQGAEFILYKTRTGNGTAESPYEYSDPVKLTEDTTPVSGFDHSYKVDPSATNTTIKAGKTRIWGLKAQDYYLVETKAPNGYNAMTEVKTITVSSAGAGTNSTDNIMTTDVTVPNEQGATLPTTGGIGTTIFYIIGGLLMVGAAVLLVVRKKMSVTE